MTYEYTVTKDSGETELIKAMSWKKMLKSLFLKTPKFNGWITYINKKGNTQVRIFREGKRFEGGGGLSNTRVPPKFM